MRKIALRMHRLSVLLFAPFAAIALAMGCGDSSAPPATPAVAAKLAFIAVPTTVTAGQMLPPILVEFQDASGARVITAQSAVTLALGTNPSGAMLAGTTTVNPVGGMATFNDVLIDHMGSGYTFVASTNELTNMTSATSAPFVVAPAFVQGSAGGYHACGVTVSGAAYCWGRNMYGELGDGTNTSRSNPVLVTGGVSFAAVSAGTYHTCGVTSAGATYCWGSNTYGQLGNGTTTDRLSPVLATGDVSAAALSAGGYHTCGVTAAGASYCWGRNDSGQLGDSTRIQRLTPVLVAGGVPFAAVNAGDHHTCGVTAAGAAYCWGENSHGQLGNPTVVQGLAPVLVQDNGAGLHFAAVSAGGLHTCGVTTEDAAYCWGYNGFGQVANGTLGNQSTPFPVTGGVSFRAITAGEYHTCGVTRSGAAYCWGDNANGQIGDGTTTDRISPVLVVGGVKFAAISAGGGFLEGFTCGITAAGAAYCWGSNSVGQLGDGTTTDRSTPVRVMP